METDFNRILWAFFYNCCAFWGRCGKLEEEAIILALRDVARCATNPFKPHGKLIPQEEKDKFFKVIPEYYKLKIQENNDTIKDIPYRGPESPLR